MMLSIISQKLFFWWNFSQNGKINLKTIWLLFELENMFLILCWLPGINPTSLQRAFERGLLKIEWMIKKLMQDKKLWSWGPYLSQEKNLFFRVMKLSVLQVLNLLARKYLEYLVEKGKCYSSIAMVDEWIARVFSACFRIPLQFNCKLVHYCKILLSPWTLLSCFPCCFPDVLIISVKPDIGLSRSLGRTSGTITVSVWTLLCLFWR